MAPSSTNPSTWDQYEGLASPSNDSLRSSAVAEDTALLDDGEDDAYGGGRSDRRRYRYTPSSSYAFPPLNYGPSLTQTRLLGLP